MLPYVSVNVLNRNQGKPEAVEKIALYVGVGSTNLNQLIAISGDSDLDKILGAEESELKRTIQTAKANCGDTANFYAYVYQVEANGYNFIKAVKNAAEFANFEYAVNTETNGVTKESLTALQTLHTELLGIYSRRIFFIQSVAGITGAQSWTQYLSALKNITKDVVADHVMVVPQLFGNDTGALAGRLAHSAVTVADSPCRVKTGNVQNLAKLERPTDKDGVLLSLAHLKQIDSLRFSSVIWYADKEGFYWGDGLTLDQDTGDYKVIENVRVADKAARAVRLLAINKIGDRSFNASLASIEANKSYFLSVLRTMATSTTIGTEYFPGECYNPKDEDIEIVWLNKNELEIYLIVRPLECPKGIKVGIALDLTTLGDGNNE